MTIFSFHPVKHITTGEGGMITTNNYELYAKLCLLRTHGITKEKKNMQQCEGTWYYEQQELGFNYRITDLQCALGLSQLKRLNEFVERRRAIAASYNNAFKKITEVIVPFQKEKVASSWHLYVLRLKSIERKKVFELLQKRGVGVSVHYIPVHLQPYYQKHFHFKNGDFQKAEYYYSQAITLPIYPAMSDNDVNHVIESVFDISRKK
jgi:dTDP-4-amino-4,6-dideoxygalactose transaminase